MAKRKPKKSGVLTLRLPPELHEDIANTAGLLGLDVTGLIRLMVRRSLPHFRFEAELNARTAEQDHVALEEWQRKNPDRPAREFLDDYVRHQRGQWLKDQVQFWHDIRFTLDEAYAATLIDDPSRIPPDATPLHPRKEQA